MHGARETSWEKPKYFWGVVVLFYLDVCLCPPPPTRPTHPPTPPFSPKLSSKKGQKLVKILLFNLPRGFFCITANKQVGWGSEREGKKEWAVFQCQGNLVSFNFLKISCKFLVNEKERWNGLLSTARAIVHDAHHVSSFQFHWNQGRRGGSLWRERERRNGGGFSLLQLCTIVTRCSLCCNPFLFFTLCTTNHVVPSREWCGGSHWGRGGRRDRGFSLVHLCTSGVLYLQFKGVRWWWPVREREKEKWRLSSAAYCAKL